MSTFSSGNAKIAPQDAEQLQIEAYKLMTGEERLIIGLRLHELAYELTREGIRAMYLEATPKEVEAKLRQRIRLGYEIAAKPELQKGWNTNC